MAQLSFFEAEKKKNVQILEYYKRNFVEYAHTKENRVLSKHDPFCSNPIHKNVTVGSKEHAQNVERVAADMRRCIIQASIRGKLLLC